MKKLLFLTLSILLISAANAQYRWDVGLALGGSNSGWSLLIEFTRRVDVTDMLRFQAGKMLLGFAAQTLEDALICLLRSEEVLLVCFALPVL